MCNDHYSVFDVFEIIILYFEHITHTDDFPSTGAWLVVIIIILYWNGHNLFVHQLLGLYLCIRVSAVQFTSDVIRTIVRRRRRLALLRNT